MRYLALLCLMGWGGVFSQNSTHNPKTNFCTGSQFSTWTNCYGYLPLKNSASYEGEFKQGMFDGMGVLNSSGTKYVGEFQKGNINGLGVEYSTNGVVIRSGTWIRGEFSYPQALNISNFPFNFSINSISQNTNDANHAINLNKNNLPECYGRLFWNECYGTEINAGGTKFVGEFKNGQKHGKGEYIWENGDKFVGEYQNNKRNGIGIDYFASGLIKESGTYKEGRLASKHYVDPTLYSFNPAVGASTTQASMPDPVKAERDRLSVELEASRKKQQDLEEQLRTSQLAVAQQPNKPIMTSGIERRVALVIGNATYKVNPLKNPVNDSTDMARSLRMVGFDVIEANNTTLAQMREATRRFADKLGNSDVGLVYYSGHGVEVKGKNYLIPVNADIKREYEVVDQAFDASQFLEMMDNIRGPNNKRVNILIVDACRNNELQKSWRSTNNGLARMDAPGGTFISFATAPGRVAADGVGRNSPYTKHLLQALKQPNVPIEQVFKVVRRNVMEETRGEQIPWENSSLVGDFYFTVQR